MALSQNLVQKQTQRLVITQDLRQSIELLPLSNIELSEKIQKELMENPMLESNSESEPDVAVQQVEAKSDKAVENQQSRDDGDTEWWRDNDKDNFRGTQDSERTERKHQFLENALSSEESLAEHLMWQLRMSDLGSEELEAGEILISAIDNKGFITEELENLFQNTKISLEIAQKVLEQIFTLDPIGCGAKDIGESLLVQAILLAPEDTITHQVLKDHLIDLEKLDYKKIEKQTGFTSDQLEVCIRFIRTLEPYPGTLYAPRNPDYVVPDIIIMEVNGKPEIIINDEWLPNLNVNESYKDLLKDKALDSKVTEAKTESDKEYLQSRLNSAQWLIKSIQQRRQTLYRVTKSILEFQEAFFLKGQGNLRPLTLREVAEKVELHESTVSRITTNKYIQTRWGVFELKYFFSSSLKSSTGGESHSARTIQDRIRQIIENEDPESPLSDQRIVDLFKEEGVQIARRTVAKYRGILKILPADRRKKLKKLNEG